MIEKLAALNEKYERLTERVSDPAVIANQSEWKKDVLARAEIEDVVLAYRQLLAAQSALDEARLMAADKSDPELAALAEQEAAEATEQISALEDQIKLLLLPKDPNDNKNVLLEIRAGTGGEEAALFAGDLYRMYSLYAEAHRWHTETVEASYSDLGGYKEVVMLVEGKGAYSKLKFESGVHRVQRVPATESSGRIHTSAATVAVLPEAEEIDVEIDPNDVRIDLFCATGPGGQCVNTTQSAVRLTHIPTGIVVSCQDEKSQIKNKAKALRVLRARVQDKLQQEASDKEALARRSMVGSGDRSERIRTYNFPERRVTDHRIGLTVHHLDQILGGALDEVVDALITEDQAQRLKA